MRRVNLPSSPRPQRRIEIDKRFRTRDIWRWKQGIQINPSDNRIRHHRLRVPVTCRLYCPSWMLPPCPIAISMSRRHDFQITSICSRCSRAISHCLPRRPTAQRRRITCAPLHQLRNRGTLRVKTVQEICFTSANYVCDLLQQVLFNRAGEVRGGVDKFVVDAAK
jgi:hypothetical protein